MRRSLAITVAALALILALPGAAAAKPVDRTVFDMSEESEFVSGLLSAACGVPLEATLSGHVIMTTFADREGVVTHELHRYSTRFVIRNPATGETMRFTDAGPDVLRYDHEAGTITFAFTGRSATGSGNAGRYVVLLDLQGNTIEDPVSVAGNSLGDWIENVCERLA